MTGFGVAIAGASYARVSWGRWVADCGNPLCQSALTLGPDVTLDDGQIMRGLAWGQVEMRCWDCGYLTETIVWPKDRIGIETLLSMRPDVKTRSWNPDERLEDLLGENVAHGLVDREAFGPGSHVLMRTADNYIIGGAILEILPDAEQRRALTAEAG